MRDQDPVVELSAFSSPGAVATPWPRARQDLQDASLYWLTTVHPDGQPNVTPLIGIWLDGAMYFTTGASERKARNLAHNPRCVLTTGHNTLDGLDLVVEGEAATVTDQTHLQRVAETFETKYGPPFTAPDGVWAGLGNSIRAGTAVQVYRLTPAKAFAFAKGQSFSQTRYRFT